MVSSVQKLLIASGSKCKSIDTQENRDTLCPINTAFRKRPSLRVKDVVNIYLSSFELCNYPSAKGKVFYHFLHKSWKEF